MRTIDYNIAEKMVKRDGFDLNFSPLSMLIKWARFLLNA